MIAASASGGISPLLRRRPTPWGGMGNGAVAALPSPTGLELGDVGGPPPVVGGDATFPSAPASRSEGSPFLAPQTPSLTPQPMPGGPDSRGAGSPFLPGGGYAATSTFGPGADLRSTQIAPSDSRATRAANGAASSALNAYTAWQPNAWQGVTAPGSYTPGADTTGLRGSLTQALSALQSAPDRGQLAAGNFNLLDQTAREASARDQRTIGQSSAKFGRIGSGITTTNLGDLGERQAIDRSRAQSQLSLDAAGQTMGDRLNVAGAIQSGFGALSGADLNNAGFNQSLRNESRGERDASNAFNAADFTRKGQLFGDTAAYARQTAGEDASRRDELRTERGFQTGMEGQAYDRNRQAIGDANTQSNTALQQALALVGAGGGTDLSGMLQQQSAQQGAQASNGMGDIASLLAQYYARRN